MEKEFWLEAWKSKNIRFHKDHFNGNLLNYFDRLKLTTNEHILVPLCGKSLDMIWLAKQGLKVTGVELSEIAIKEFFKENKLNYCIEEFGELKKYTSDNISIFVGDIFHLTAKQIGKIDAIYDRASTVALPEDMRRKLMTKFKELSPKLNMLMVLFYYDQSLVDGPPFSVSEAFITEEFKTQEIQILKEVELEKLAPKFIEVGAKVKEIVLLVRN